MHRALFAFVALFLTLPAFANEGAPAEPAHGEVHDLQPATRYNGDTPIDLNHGRLGANGTVGMANPDYERIAKSELMAPGLIAAPYPYSHRKEFLTNLEDRLHFFSEAIQNLGDDSGEMSKKPEVKAFGDKLLPQLKERYEAAHKAWKDANGAGEGDWKNAEHNARSAFVSLKTTYETAVKTQAQ